MLDRGTCPECGEELPTDAPDGLCPNCIATVPQTPDPDDLLPTRITTEPQSAEFAASEDPGALTAGRYKLLRQLGEGGFGVVYLAEQEEPVRRKVALKVIKLGMDTKQVVVRFEAERQALAMMDHPNIAKVLDGGVTENGRPFFVMEFVDGIPITDYCDGQNLKTERRLELFMTVCQVAAVLRKNSSNRIAAERVMFTLSQRSFALPLTPPLRHLNERLSAGYAVISAEFSPDGSRVLTASSDNTAQVWEVPVAVSPIPGWLAELAEAVGGQRQDAQRGAQPVPANDALQLKRSIQGRQTSDYYTRWAQWFFADRTSRTISAFSPITLPEYIQRRVEENTLASLQEAVSLVSTNALALARLAFKSPQPEVA